MKNFKQLFCTLLVLCFSACCAIADNTEALPLDAQAMIASQQGNNTKALYLMNKAIKQNTNSYSYYNNRGVIKESAKDYNGAIADYTTAIKLNPNYATAYNNRGSLYKNLNNGVLAAVDLCRYAELQPSYESYTSLGYLMLDGAKNYKNAVNYFTKAISFIQPEIDRFNKKVAEGLAFGKKDMSEFEGAYYGRGLSYFFLNDSTKAIQDFNKAISYSSFNPDAYLFRGLAKSSIGNKTGALNDINTAKQQYSQDGNQTGYDKALSALNMVRRL